MPFILFIDLFIYNFFEVHTLLYKQSSLMLDVASPVGILLFLDQIKVNQNFKSEPSKSEK